MYCMQFLIHAWVIYKTSFKAHETTLYQIDDMRNGSDSLLSTLG